MPRFYNDARLRRQEANLLREEFQRQERERLRRQRWDAADLRRDNYRHTLRQAENVRVLENNARVNRFNNRMALQQERNAVRSAQLNEMTRQEFQRRERLTRAIDQQNLGPNEYRQRTETAQRIEHAQADRLITRHRRNLSDFDNFNRRNQREFQRQAREEQRQRTWGVRMNNRETLAAQGWFQEQDRRQQEDRRQRAERDRAHVRRVELNRGFNFMPAARR